MLQVEYIPPPLLIIEINSVRLDLNMPDLRVGWYLLITYPQTHICIPILKLSIT